MQTNPPESLLQQHRWSNAMLISKYLKFLLNSYLGELSVQTPRKCPYCSHFLSNRASQEPSPPVIVTFNLQCKAISSLEQSACNKSMSLWLHGGCISLCLELARSRLLGRLHLLGLGRLTLLPFLRGSGLHPTTLTPRTGRCRTKFTPRLRHLLSTRSLGQTQSRTACCLI